MSKEANIQLPGDCTFIGFRQVNTTPGRMGLPLNHYVYRVRRADGKVDELPMAEFREEFGNAGLTEILRWEQKQ